MPVSSRSPATRIIPARGNTPNRHGPAVLVSGPPAAATRNSQNLRNTNKTLRGNRCCRPRGLASMKLAASLQTGVAGAVVVFTWRGRSVSDLIPCFISSFPRARALVTVSGPHDTWEPCSRIQDCSGGRPIRYVSRPRPLRSLDRRFGVRTTCQNHHQLFCHQRTCPSDTPQTMAVLLPPTFLHATDADTTGSAPVLPLTRLAGRLSSSSRRSTRQQQAVHIRSLHGPPPSVLALPTFRRTGRTLSELPGRSTV